MKRPTIEGLPSPAAREERSGDAAAGPGLKLDVVRNVRRRPKLAVGVAAGVFLALLAFGLTRHRMYLAQSLTYVEPQASKVLSEGPAGGYDPSRYESYLQQQMQTALRPDILTSAIERLPPFTWQRAGESMPSAVFRLQNNLKVLRVGMSYQLAIQLMDVSPEKAAAVVNAVTDSYLEQGRKDERAITDQRLKLLGEERQRIEQVLSEDRVEQASLAKELGLASPTGPGVTQYDAQIAGAETQVAAARQARDMAAAQFASMQGGAGLDAAADEQLLTDSGLNSMKGTINTRKAVLSTQMAGLTPNNPIYQQDAAEIADLDRSLDRMTNEIREKAARRLQDKMRTDVQRTADIEGRLNAQLRQQTATASGIAPKLQRAADLAADLTRLNARYTVVDDTMRSLELEANGPGLAHLSVAATVPVAPEPSKRRLILLLALPLGLFAGLFAAVVAGLMDPKVYSGGDVERVLGFLPIAVMPAASEVSSRVLEEYTLRLAAGLQSAFRVSGAQSFVFAAASSTIETGEFVRSIERVLAGLGFKALALEGTGLLRAETRTTSQRGVASFRTGALVKTIEGNRQGHAMEELERLKQSYDLILIDAPPLLHSAETEYLVRCADATILIAESGVTLKAELFRSATLLQQLNVAGVGAVLQELHLQDADEAFRAAVEAVERIQRSRREPQPNRETERELLQEGATRAEAEAEQAREALVAERRREERVVEHVAEPAAERAAEPMLQGRPEQHGEQHAEQENRREEPPVSVQDKPEDRADEPWHWTAPAEATEGSVRTLRVEIEHEAVTQAVPVSQTEAATGTEREKEPEDVGAWRDLWKKTAGKAMEPAAQDEPRTRTEAVRSDEPMLFFEDRLRPKRNEESQAAAATREEAAIEFEEPVVLAVGPDVLTVEPDVAAEMFVPAATMDAAPFEPQRLEHQPALTQEFAANEPAADWSFAHQATEDEWFESPVARGEDLGVEHEAGHDIGQGVVGGTSEAMIAGETEPAAAETIAEDNVVSLDQAEPLREIEALPATPAERMREVEPEVPVVASTAEAPVTKRAASVPVAAGPKAEREPSSPRMEWFTLKFRGTSERVLRIVPGEMEDETESKAAAGEAIASVAAEGEGAAEVEPKYGQHAGGAGDEERPHEQAVAETVAEAVEREEPVAASSSVEYAAPMSASLAGVGREEAFAQQAVHAEGGEPVAEVAEDETFLDYAAEPVAGSVHGGYQADEALPAEQSGEPRPTEPEWSMPVEEAGYEENAEIALEASEPAREEYRVLGMGDETAETAEKEVLPILSLAEAVNEPVEAEESVTADESFFPEPVAAESHAAAMHETPADTLAEAERVEALRLAQVGEEAAVAGATQPVAAAVMETDMTQAGPVPAPRAGNGWKALDHLAPARLVGELRSRTSLGAPREWNRRNVGAPVEERLEPRAASLTRRWEMLSRFDVASEAKGSKQLDEAGDKVAAGESESR